MISCPKPMGARLLLNFGGFILCDGVSWWLSLFLVGSSALAVPVGAGLPPLQRKGCETFQEPGGKLWVLLPRKFTSTNRCACACVRARAHTHTHTAKDSLRLPESSLRWRVPALKLGRRAKDSSSSQGPRQAGCERQALGECCPGRAPHSTGS